MAATALARLQNMRARFRDAQAQLAAVKTERDQAILDAVNAGAPLREVAEVAEISHETVRRIVAADGQVTLELNGETFRLTARQVEVQIYKLSGLAQGAFPGEIQRLGVGTDWFPDAAKLAHQLQAAMADEEGASVKLTEKTGWPLYLAICGTYYDGLSVFSRLREMLQARYPAQAQQVVASIQQHARPLTF
jgi:hypothetical protein